MGAGDTARHSYAAARAEILQRMRLRDNVLLVFLAVSGAILGVALRGSGNNEVLLSIPFLALGTAILVSQHNLLAAVLGQFCAHELEPFLKSLEPSEHAPNWDNSRTFKQFANEAAKLRLIGHGIIILVPCVLALAMNWDHALNSPFPLGPLWWFGAMCSIVAAGVIINSHARRVDIYNKRKWPENRDQESTDE